MPHNPNTSTSILTFNLQGKLKNPLARQTLCEDMIRKNIDVGCFQETKMKSDDTFQIENQKGVIMNVATQETGKEHIYGMGFYISNTWWQIFDGIERINDRIIAIHFRINEKNKQNRLTILNVYSPTEVSPDITEKENFYATLESTTQRLKRNRCMSL